MVSVSEPSESEEISQIGNGSRLSENEVGAVSSEVDEEAEFDAKDDAEAEADVNDESVLGR